MRKPTRADWAACQRTRRECRRLAWYLIGVRPGEEVITRYTCGIGGLKIPDSSALALAMRHGWLLGPLDAACALIRRDDGLRQRLILLSALLETDVPTAGKYLPGDHSLIRIVAGVGASGIRAAFNLAIGMIVLPFLR